MNSSAESSPLKRVIGIGGLGFTGMNLIVGSGIFGLPAVVAALLGPAAVLSYLVCAVLVGLVGLCLAEAGSRIGSAGGLYAYARVPFGPIVGGIAGTLLWFANTAAANAAVANLLVDTLAAVRPEFTIPSVRMLFLLGIYAILATVNIRGSRSGLRLSVALTLIKLTPLVVLVVVGIFSIRASNLEWTSTPALFTVGQGAVVMFFAFMGIEGALSTSGEVKNPARTVPRAILLALLVVATLYIGLQVVAQGILGSELAHAKAPLVETATAVFGPWGGRLLLAATILSVTGFLAGDLLCSPRVLYALGEEGQLPRKLAFVHPRFGTPAIAVAAYVVLCAALALSGSFRQLVVIAASGTLLLYLICCLGVLRLRARDVRTDGNPFNVPGGPIIPLAASVIIIWMLTTLEMKELLILSGFVAVSGLVYAVRARNGRVPLAKQVQNVE